MTSSKPLPLPRRTSALIVGSGPAALIALKYALESTAWAPGAAPVLISADEYDYYEPKAADTQTDSVDIQLRGDISDLVRGQSTPAACLAEYISTFGLAQHTHRGAVLRVEHEEGAYPHVATVRHACWGDMDQVVNIAAQRLVLVRSPKVEVKVDGGRVDKALPSGSAWRPAFGPRSLSREDAPKTKSRTPRLRSRKRHASGPLANGRGQTPDWLRIQAEQHWKQLIQLVPVRLSLGSVPLPLALPLTVLAGLPKLPPLPLVSSLVTVSHVAASIARTAADAHALIFTELDEFGVPPKKNDLWDAVRAFLDPIPASPAAPVPAPPSPKLQIHTPVAVRFDDARAPRIPLAGGKRKRRRSSEGGLEDEEELVSGRSRSDSSEGSEGGYVRIVPMVLVTPPEPAPAPSGLDVLSSTYARPPLSVRGVCGADLSVGYIGFHNSHAASDTEALDTATAEMQAMFFFLLAQDRMPLPEAPRPLIRLPLQLPLRSRRAESYLAQLATDMGTEPSALQLLAEYGWRHTAVYFLAPRSAATYRLIGPYASPRAGARVYAQWAEVCDRGIIANALILIGVVWAAVLRALLKRVGLES